MSGEFAFQYRDLLTDLTSESCYTIEHNVRTGHNTRVLYGGWSFNIDLYNENQSMPVPDCRRVYPGTAAAEVAWFVSGRQDTDFLHEQGITIWNKFVEDDGRTVDAAYGYRWRRRFGRDQLREAVEALRADPTTRRCVVMAWDPMKDGLQSKGQRNVPCPVGFTLHLSESLLHSTLLIRSSDVFVGLPYDVMGHALLMAMIGQSLGASPGVMTVTLAHAHLYEIHAKMAKEALEQRPFTCGGQPPLPVGWALERVEHDPAGYVAHVREIARNHSKWPDYAPRPEVVA